MRQGFTPSTFRRCAGAQWFQQWNGSAIPSSSNRETTYTQCVPPSPKWPICFASCSIGNMLFHKNGVSVPDFSCMVPFYLRLPQSGQYSRGPNRLLVIFSRKRIACCANFLFLAIVDIWISTAMKMRRVYLPPNGGWEVGRSNTFCTFCLSSIQ